MAKKVLINAISCNKIKTIKINDKYKSRKFITFVL